MSDRENYRRNRAVTDRTLERKEKWPKTTGRGSGLSRRQFLGGAAVAAIGVAAPGAGKMYGQARQTTDEVRDLALINGKIHTMDRDRQRRLAGADPQRPLRRSRQ